ncbi:hypothetical protein SUGI_0227110 [Cryptomeria japonica]|nr:hypothetical protein SUGI_0227110 [Cryptomeria japonica]
MIQSLVWEGEGGRTQSTQRTGALNYGWGLKQERVKLRKREKGRNSRDLLQLSVGFIRRVRLHCELYSPLHLKCVQNHIRSAAVCDILRFR